MLIKYNKNTDRFDLMGLTISDLSAIWSALERAGVYAEPHKKLSEKIEAAMSELEKRTQSKII